jgi:peptidoglycan/xylan/chitin deacetylase (PgdA/CDA1 family)
VKHQAKQLFRDLYARALYYSGLHAVVNRMMPKRFTILLGHCLEASEVNGGLPADMKISAGKLRPMLTWLNKRYSMGTLSSSLEALSSSANGPSLVALTMDDGYRDNATHLLPFLQELNIPATIYLESRPLDERRTNWSHLFFWLVKREGAEAVARRYLTLSEDADTLEGLRRVLEEGDEKLEYRVKRVLKYDADFDDRDRVLGELFRQSGGDEQALADELYLTWDQARQLRDAGWELGGHTINHPVLARLTEAQASEEIGTGGASLARELGADATSFAYPFGRPWDYDENSLNAVRSSKFKNAVTTTAGTNDPKTDPFKLKRIAIGEESQMHSIVAEVCGGFDLLRRFGLDLSA